MNIDEELPTLPFTDLKDRKWSFLYAYNIRIIRDLFVYCALKKKITQEELYKAMDTNNIPPPKERWATPNRKKVDRLKLEYVHAAMYLGLLNEMHGYFKPDFSQNLSEKETILDENKGRTFEPAISSPPLTEKEKKALLTIVLNYKRARDFLRWFLDFRRYPSILSFNESDFRKDAKPLYILSKIETDKKARQFLRRESDCKVWKIPNENPNDYTRLVSFVLPNWFEELGLIGRVIVFPEFSFDGNIWHMYYPIKSDFVLTTEMLKKEIFGLFEPYEEKKTIWLPFLLYVLAKKLNCAVKTIKSMLLKLNEQDFSSFILERSSLQVMRYAGKIHFPLYEASFMKIDDFYIGYLIASRKNGEQNG
jgi:hypothetical protein